MLVLLSVEIECAFCSILNSASLSPPCPTYRRVKIVLDNSRNLQSNIDSSPLGDSQTFAYVSILKRMQRKREGRKEVVIQGQ